MKLSPVILCAGCFECIGKGSCTGRAQIWSSRISPGAETSGICPGGRGRRESTRQPCPSIRGTRGCSTESWQLNSRGQSGWWLSGYISGLSIVGLVGLGVAELKGTNWWWLSGHLIGYGIMGLVVQNEFFAGSSDAPLSKEAYQTIRGKGNGYVEGFRDGYQRRIRERREASNRDGSFWGIGTVTGVLTAGAILMMVD